jgi:hypothetical protein
MRASAGVLVACVVAVGGCGPSNPKGGGGGDGGGSQGSDADGGPPPPPPPTGSVAGTVWAPGNAIGAVPAGFEIPVPAAMIYLADGDLAAIPDSVYCDRCEAQPPAGYVLSDAKGKFLLNNASPGKHRLVIEKAQFRLAIDIDVPSDTGLTLSTAQSTLPSIHDPAHGKWLPRVAIAVGDSDHIEDVLGKMGVLDLDSSHSSVIESSFAATDRVEIWGNPTNPPFTAAQKGSITDLFSDLNKMKRYHIIFVPCNYYSDVTALQKPAVRKNIQDYVAAGGKLYVTDWSAEWEDAAFPDFIGFDASTDTTSAMVAANNINTGDGDFGGFTHGKVLDPTMAAWLDGQKAPQIIPAGGEAEDWPADYSSGEPTNASDFLIAGSWSLIRTLPAVKIGTDAMGMPITNTAKTWISGDYMGAVYPRTVTFEPSCGRVLYSTYHTAEKPHEWLVPQERVLLYLIMEIGVCNDGPVVF